MYRYCREENILNKNILAIGIIILFIISILTPIVIGYKTSIESAHSIANGGLMDSPWPMHSHDLHHTGRSPYSTADNPDIEKWRFKADAWVNGGIVIDNDGVIYFGDDYKTFYAVYPNGTLKWRTGISCCGVMSTPAISKDGTIYVGTWAGLGGEKLHAINPDGTMKWEFLTNDMITSSPAIDEDGTIYFGCWNDHLYALNPNGTLKWRYKAESWITSDPAIADDGTIYFGSSDGYLYAIYPNGTLRWRFKTSDWIKSHPSIGDDRTIYFYSFDDYFYTLYPNGTLKWRKELSCTGTTGSPIAKDGTIYACGYKLYALAPDGTIKWSFDLWENGLRRISHNTPAISADGTLYFGTTIYDGEGGEIIAVNSDGTELWRSKKLANFVIRSSPCIGEDGTVYIGSASSKMNKRGYVDSVGYLHAFGSVDSNQPPEKPVITGKVNGKAGSEYYYGFSTVDPDNNPVSFYVEWGDGTSSDWTGGGLSGHMLKECASGEIVYLRHVYESEGVFTIRVKARDTLSEESDWATLTVTMPRNKLINNPIFTKFIDGFMDRFPLFARLLNLQ